jgi:hypothetical protein
MTLSTFRQLPERPIWTSAPLNLSLRGIPWGRVLYFWGDQSKDGFHVVWQDGNDLFRDHVTPHPSSGWLRSALGYSSEYQEGTDLKTEEGKLVSSRNALRDAKAGLVYAERELSELRPRTLYSPENRKETQDEVRERTEKAVTDAIAYVDKAISAEESAALPLEESRILATRAASATAAARLAFNGAFANLAALPQLYIAV